MVNTLRFACLVHASCSTTGHVPGCDILLMPSRFEPCGLNQLFAMRYGTVPIAHATGGLRDTIANYTPEAEGTPSPNLMPEALYPMPISACLAQHLSQHSCPTLSF